ncbi:MAG: MarR family transcriptional regulator [Vicinamibacterales bacterium]
MEPDDAARLLDRIGVLRHRCDLDLLLFLVRHPRSLLTSDQLVAYLGYSVTQVGDSLDVLQAANLLARSPSLTHPARLYVLAAEGPAAEWLSTLMDTASKRGGRFALRQALTRGSRDRGGVARTAVPRSNPT